MSNAKIVLTLKVVSDFYPRHPIFGLVGGFFVGLSVTLWPGMTLGGGYSMMTGTWYVIYIFLPSPFKHLPSDFRCHSPVPVTFRKGKEKLKVE